MDYVVNPKTNRKIKIGSKVWLQLTKEGVIKGVQTSKPCPPPKVRNPESNRCITLDGALFQKLIKKGVQFEQDFENVTKSKKVCKPSEILNPISQRCIKKHGSLYKKLLKQGVDFHDDDLHRLNSKTDINIRTKYNEKNAKQECKNQETFVMFEPVNEIPHDKLVVLAPGYCFHLDEITAYVESSGFNNRNPHDNHLDLFKHDQIISNDRLQKAVSAFFAKQRKTRDERRAVLKQHMDILYAIGDTGRICLYDNITSHETNSSAVFEWSIEALSNLTAIINKLSKKDQSVFLDLETIDHNKLELYLKCANEGTMCIHGIGYALIFIFVKAFLEIESTLPDITCDPLKASLYFKMDHNTNRLVFHNLQNRFYVDVTAKASDSYYIQKYNSLVPAVLPKSSTLFTRHMTIKCLQQSMYATIDALDSWNLLDVWRLFSTEDGHCFDILYMIKVITDQLNMDKHMNPYPQYPNNPFTKQIFSQADLKLLRRLITCNMLKCSPVLHTFLANEDLWLSKSSARWTTKCIDAFEQSMRYVRIFNGIDAGEITILGYWNHKHVPVEVHEQVVLDFLGNYDEETRAVLESMQKKYKYPISMSSDYYCYDGGNIVGFKKRSFKL